MKSIRTTQVVVKKDIGVIRIKKEREWKDLEKLRSCVIIASFRKISKKLNTS